MIDYITKRLIDYASTCCDRECHIRLQDIIVVYPSYNQSILGQKWLSLIGDSNPNNLTECEWRQVSDCVFTHFKECQVTFCVRSDTLQFKW